MIHRSYPWAKAAPYWLAVARRNTRRGRRIVERLIREGVVNARLIDLGLRLADAEAALASLAAFFDGRGKQ